MFQKLTKAALPKKTLATILNGFNQTLADLTELRKSNDTKITCHEGVIAKSQAESAFLKAENDRASRVEEKIKAIIQ